MARAATFLALALLGGCAGALEPLPGRAGYQALGHDPAWVLTMRDGALKFVGSDPRTAMEILAPVPEPTAYGRRYSSERLTLEITRQPCNDVRSGVAFSDTVALVVDRYNYRGCGGERMPLLDL